MSDTAEPWSLWQKIAAPIAAIVLAWEVLPPLDLLLSGLAYRTTGGGFWLRDIWPLMIVYWGTRVMTTTLVIGLLGLVMYGLLGAEPPRKALARRAALALLTMAIGSGFIVHTVLKDHWGRPRPSQIVNFGGTGHYVMPGIPSDQCATNCSFTSGHAAAGFALMAGGLVWPLQRRRWFWIGLGVGSFIGAVRIVQGGHFFSDVFGSAVVVFGTVTVIEMWAQSRGWLNLPQPAKSPP